MKINFNQNLKALNGTDLIENQRDGSVGTISLKDICSSALANKTEGDAIEKQQTYKLAVDIANSTEAIEVSAEQISDIKKQLVSFPALYCGQACLMLEGGIDA